MPLSNRWPFSPALSRAIERVQRWRFVPENQRAEVDGDYPLPIGHGQTISQPSLVAYMTEMLEVTPQSRILEIGTGCGYQTAILAELCAEVYTIEIVPELAASSRERLTQLGYTNIHFRQGSGYEGWPSGAPFDGIIVTAAAPYIPNALLEQLAVGSRMVIPVGPDGGIQRLTLIERTLEDFDQKELLDVRFVPMVHDTVKTD